MGRNKSDYTHQGMYFEQYLVRAVICIRGGGPESFESEKVGQIFIELYKNSGNFAEISKKMGNMNPRDGEFLLKSFACPPKIFLARAPIRAVHQ